MIILLYHYLFSIVFIILYFHFRSRISFTFTFRILSVLVSHLLFYLVFALFHLLSFLLSIIPRDILTQKCRAKTKSFILFSSRHINIRFIFFLLLLFFMGPCFTFYLIAVLICYLYLLTNRRQQCLWNTEAGVFSSQVGCWWP